MTTNSHSEPSSLEAWNAIGLRCTVFLAPGPIGDQDTWWNEVVGDAPETSTSKLKIGQLLQESPHGDGRLILSIRPGKIDWMWRTGLPEESVESIPTIGGFQECCVSFVELLQRWFEMPDIPRLQRIGFGGIIVQPVDDRLAAYKKLSEYLPELKIDGEVSCNLLYQINKPIPAKSIDDLSVNRLCKWSALQVGSYSMTIVDGMPKPFAEGGHFDACQLDFDVNTNGAFDGEFSLEEAWNVFLELVELSKTIAAKGYAI